MRILLMGQHFWPEDISGAVLATQLAESMTQRNHQVTFATCFPNYPMGKLFDGYENKLISRETYKGIMIIRTWSYLAPKEAIKQRFINYATFSLTALLSGFSAPRSDVMMSYSPPMPLGLAAMLTSKLRGIPWLLRVEDLFPEYAIKAGVIRNPVLIRVLNWIERLLYRNATHISVISEGFRQKLLERGVPADKISVTPVWADPDEVKPMPRETNFRAEHGWQDKFIVLYSGNLGLTSGLEDALDAAEILQIHEGIHFVIVGEGMKKSQYMELVEKKRLRNVTFLPYQPRERFPELLASADVMLVTLTEDSQSTSLPGKTFNYLASGRPILVVAPLISELSTTIKNAEAGVCIPLAKPDLLADAVLSLKAHETTCIEMGDKGRYLLETFFSRQHCVDLYESMFNRLSGQR